MRMRNEKGWGSRQNLEKMNLNSAEDKKMNGQSVAGLLHVFDWKLAASEVKLSPSIVLGRVESSPIGKLYEELCAVQGLDDGGFSFPSYVALEPHEYILNYGDPYGLFDRVCNVIAIVTSHPVAMSRLLLSSDGFKTCDDTQMIYTYGAQTEFLMAGDFTITEKNMAEIYKAWQVASAGWEKYKASGRVQNALTYFYYAWRSQYLDQTCLNLAIALEVLFSPHSQGETTHQTSFNVAHFLATSPGERKRYYDLIERFFGLRSSVVHGAMPEDDKLRDVTVQVFGLCSLILKRILLNADLAQAFAHNNLRTDMLLKFMFA
jgi:hypothetical protein